MGIKNINSLLKEHAANAFTTIPLVSLHGFRIGIDGCNYIYGIMGNSVRDIVLGMVDPLEEIDRGQVMQKAKEALIRFISQLSSYGVTLVWVWDGVAPKDKDACRAKRKADKDRVLQRIVAGRQLLESVHPLARTADQIRDYKKLLAQHNSVATDEMKHLRGIIEILGFPSVQAESEGEKLAASLAREGLVAGVWSSDTDNYVLQTPLLVTGFAGMDPDQRPVVSVVSLPTMLASIGKPHAWLLDFAIMCGCDFNTNMPGVGVKRSWDLMVKYGSIDAIAAAEPHRPIDVLRHVRCRELFAVQLSGFQHDSPKLNFNKQQFTTYISDVVQQYNLSNQYEQLVSSSRHIIPPRQVYVAPIRKSRLLIVKSSTSSPQDQPKSTAQAVVQSPNEENQNSAPSQTVPQNTNIDAGLKLPPSTELFLNFGKPILSPNTEPPANKINIGLIPPLGAQLPVIQMVGINQALTPSSLPQPMKGRVVKPKKGKAPLSSAASELHQFLSSNIPMHPVSPSQLNLSGLSICG